MKLQTEGSISDADTREQQEGGRPESFPAAKAQKVKPMTTGSQLENLGFSRK